MYDSIFKTSFLFGIEIFVNTFYVNIVDAFIPSIIYVNILDVFDPISAVPFQSVLG